VNDRLRLGLVRIGALFASIPIAYAVGLLTHSVHAFEVVMMIGLGVNILLRFTVLRRWG
jgi:hypothetical protein